jgi:tRNA (guanine-N1)-methyltransferase
VRISLLTIFPDFFGPALDEGMIRLAREKGRLEVGIVPLREFTDDSHRSTDDYPFGGGVGMIMKIEPIHRALESLAVGEKGARPTGTRVVLFSPQGRPFTQELAIEYATLEHLVLVNGRYKGVDERVSERLVDEELSLGDFVLSGGEPAALCVVDAVARLLPDVVGSFDSVEGDSFHSGLLDSALLHAAGRVPGLAGARGPALGPPRPDRPLAPRAGAQAHAGAAPDLLETADLPDDDRRFLRRLGWKGGRGS